MLRVLNLFLLLLLLSCRDSGNEPKPVEPLPDVPRIYITTAQAITSKSEYVTGSIKIVGSEGFQDYTGSTRIRLRGNSSLGGPKYSYRIKLDNGAALLGLKSNRDWILLANQIDETLLTSAVAMKVGELLQMPYTNHIIPVDVTVNGQYVGSYVFTEQIEVGKNRIDIALGGQLLEFDQYMDEQAQFYEQHFSLPAIVHYPDITQPEALQAIQAELETFTSRVASPSFPSNDYLDFVDEGALINYLLAMLLTDNEEINHPKSTFLFKPAGGKYHMGPMWDFDWGFGFESSGAHIERHNSPLFWTPHANYTGTNFFHRFLKDPALKAKLLERWAAFKLTELPKLIQFTREYGTTIEKSYARDRVRWAAIHSNRPATPPTEKMVNWLNNRAIFLDQYIANF